MLQKTFVGPYGTEQPHPRSKCPRTNCGHDASKHKTRPGGKTHYCLSCAIETDRGWRSKQHICYLDAEAIPMLNDIDRISRQLKKNPPDSKSRRAAQMADAS